MNKPKKLWKCPECGYAFTGKNMWHSCGIFDLEHHFENKEPVVAKLFDRFRKMVESCGDVLCYSQKTRIVFQSRIRFAHCLTQKSVLRCGLILDREYPGHKKLVKVERYGKRSFGHYFKMSKTEDFDSEFMALIKNAYDAGSDPKEAQ